MPLKKATASDLEAATAGLRAAWGERAACRRDAGLLDPDSPDWVDEATAVAVCRACPVIAECRKWVLALPASVDVGARDRVLAGPDPPRRTQTLLQAVHDGDGPPHGGAPSCPDQRRNPLMTDRIVQSGDSIDVLGLTARPYNTLKRNGIYTVGALTDCTETDITDMRNSGVRTLGEIRDRLAVHGLALHGEEPPTP